jgi:hypothetical protein
VKYSGESVLETSRIVHLEPFKRNVIVTQHKPYAADLEEHKWLLRCGVPDLWYEKPHQSFFRKMKTFEATSYELPELIPSYDPRPVSLETPRIWATRALTTPTDDDVYDCTAGHTLEGGHTSTCPQCSEEKFEALDATSLVYWLVITACQASNPFVHGSHFNGKQIYKLIKCGSRAAATSEAFYTTGVNGWSVTSCCVTRLGESFDDRNGKAVAQEELWMLAEDGDDDENVRVFY